MTNNAASADATLRHPVPRQLPAGILGFVGRQAELAALEALIAQPTGEPATTVVTVDGTAAVGKTALAVHWAHQVADRYPDGQLYVNLHGFGPGVPLDPDRALRGFLQALGVGPAAIPDDRDPKGRLEARAALFRSLLAGRRMLVLLDNARSADDVRPLLPGTSTCLTVVTSRSELEGLRVRYGAVRITAGLLPRSDAVALLARRLRAPGDDVWPELDELAGQCAYLPLALAIAGARADDGSREAIRRLVTDLRDLRSRLDVLGSDEADLDLRTVFKWSYESLSPPAANLFALLGLHPGPDIDEYACAALLGVHELPGRALRTLTGANLLTEHEHQHERRSLRFTSHDLLRGFAHELAAGLDAAETRTALGRLLDYYLATAQAADAAAQPWVSYRHPPTAGAEPVPVAADVAPAGGTLAATDETPISASWPQPPIVTEDDATAWFEAELPVLLSMVEIAAAEGFESHAWRLAWALMVFLRRTGRRTERAEVHRMAAEAADRAGHRHARAASRRKLADALARLGRQSEAHPLLATALAEFEELGDDDGARQVHLSFARVLESEQRYAEALHHAREALALARDEPGPAAGTLRGDDPARGAEPLAVADCLTSASIQLCHLGQYEEALSDGSQALDLYTRIGHREGRANILRHLGRAEGKLGRHAVAIAHHEQSRQLDSQLGDRFWEAQAMDNLADEYLATGDEATAHRWREQALTVLESLSHPEAEAVRAKLHGSGG
ncbi:tetratricopeptide repeat protein [Frankia sp. QA3]|uniref:ATP-binding protein n=1 Tax=Frankia sp. QA3 TaxID=710111 RepID=UPI001E474541|nr:tetratricopeptide repeat protein [Frankia sp. QA3]